MSDEQENVGAGSETSGESVQETVATETETTASQEAPVEESNAGAEVAAEQKAGDACTCPDGRVGTLTANEDGTFTCIPNQG